MKKIGLNEVQAAEARQKYGSNALTQVEAEGFWRKLKTNFNDPMIKILCLALGINVIFAAMGQAHWYESAGIALAVVLATVVSTYSEYSNENSFQKLQDEASQILCKVFRSAKITEVPIDDIVVGDYILLQMGDKIPADGILVDGEIKTDQSVLNGESKEAVKRVQPAACQQLVETMDFLNEYKVFRGTVVCSGNAVMQVETVGDSTVYGKIAQELQQDVERESPLKVKLAALAHQISVFGYTGGLAIALALLFQRIVIHNGFEMSRIAAYTANLFNVVNDLISAVILAVIIIVMAVPEGLPLMIAIVSALNMRKMLRDNVLVRKIAGIETAGSLNILFSDKTGTITKGKLEVVTFIDGTCREYRECSELEGGLGRLLALSIHGNTNALIQQNGSELSVIGGNATERAVLSFGAACSNEIKVSTVRTITFNSTNKYSATQVRGELNGTLIKGAPEKVLQNCRYYYDAQGTRQPLTTAGKIEDKINVLAGKAIRVLALATAEEALGEDSLPQGEWTLVGIVGIRDEVRPESITAIRQVQEAGVQVVMITGDRQDTAVAIAMEAGILKDRNDLVWTSDQLAQMSDEEVKQHIRDLRVVARALPMDKSRLVGLVQELGMVVGMTGDGVNDSPALKRADVGFSMGGGTEVAKEASDIVIMDDNFNSIAKAILYGRTIFNNVRKFIIFQLTINVSAVLISFAAPLLGMENPLSITQILWINLVMDTLAALAFGGEPALAAYMQERPKQRGENIISGYMKKAILTGGLWIFAVSLVILLTAWGRGLFRFSPDNEYLLTGYFTFFILSAVFNGFNARTEKLNVLTHLKENRGFIEVMTLVVIVQAVMVYLGGVILRCHGLSGSEWLAVGLLSLSIIPVDLLRKWLLK